MLNQRSFSEILENIHSENTIAPESNAASAAATEMINAGWESLLEPSHMAFLMTHITPISTISPYARKAYPQPKRPSHLLDTEQRSAFEALQAHAPRLQDNFNSRELRSAYRLSVLKTHPDQGGTAESFQLVKKSYQILFAFVNKDV